MTYPLIGNCGVNSEDVESARPFLSGFVVKECSEFPCSWRAEMTLDAYLKKHGIIAIHDIDTRALVLHIRDRGAQTGIISTLENDPHRLVEKARRAPSLVGRDLVREVTCHEPYEWSESLWEPGRGYARGGEGRFKVVAYDFGIKRNILRNLVSHGCSVTVVPADMPAEKVLALKPDGVFLSNGPGDPGPITYAQENIRKLFGKVSIFGICLGHQLIALALGGSTYKLKFGHRGGNQPIQRQDGKNIEITSQNHGFAVDGGSIQGEAVLTHINLNDNTVEGLCHEKYPLFSVQYHPEASPGPHDARYLFERFIQMMEVQKTARRS
jgi:carbamoyl-phosphate synthase small subunit